MHRTPEETLALIALATSGYCIHLTTLQPTSKSQMSGRSFPTTPMSSRNPE